MTRARSVDPIARFAARTTVISGVIAAVGLVFLAAMFVAFALGATPGALILGRINDVCVLVSYLLCVPCVAALWLLLRPAAPLSSALAALLGLGSIAAIVVLQWLLITDVVTFEEQVGPVSIALLALGAWLVLTGHLRSASGVLPGGIGLGLVGATYLGYPVWAIRTGRRLPHAARTGGSGRAPGPRAAQPVADR